MPVDRPAPASSNETKELRACALLLLAETRPAGKVTGTRALHAAWTAGEITLETDQVLQPVAAVPGRPARPPLVPPRAVARRSVRSPQGRAVLIHALAHIEFNAINLALDALWRFPGLPRDYYADWLQVAAEEALHFSLLDAHLQTLGHSYGDFDAHDSLWEMAEKTRDDALARMALVPRTLEARGLDATPAVRQKLAQAGDLAAADILDIILRDEIGHVAIGNRWFGWLCAQHGVSPTQIYPVLAARHRAPVLKGPFNLEARRAAGFSEAELTALAQPPADAAPAAALSPSSSSATHR